MSKVDDLAVKLARQQVRSYVRKTDQGFIPVAAYTRQVSIQAEDIGRATEVRALDAKGKVVGSLRISNGLGASTVDWIEVDPQARKQGIAERMAQAWHTKHPNAWLKHGNFDTPVGRRWGEAMTARHPEWNLVEDDEEDDD